MITIPRLRIGVAVSFVCATAALAQSNPGRQVRTYAFRATEPNADVVEEGMKCETPLIQDQTNAAIAAQLDNRGMRRHDEHPDVYVITHRWFELRYTFYGPYDFTWEPSDPSLFQGLKKPCRSAWVGHNGWHGFNGGVYADLYDSLRVDLQDATTGAILWQRTETRRVPQNSRQDKQMIKQVAEVFEHFPASLLGGVAHVAGQR